MSTTGLEKRLNEFTLSLRKTTAFKITMIYVVISGAWIAISDSLVSTVAQNQQLYHQLQTAKGWLFVGASALLLYSMMVHRERRLQRTNHHLEQAVQQVSILHRVLRHNLRNILNVIYGNVELLEGLSEEERLKLIKEKVQDLIDLSEKSGYLHKVALGDEIDMTAIDIEETVDQVREELQEKYPQATFHTEYAEVGDVLVLPRFEIVLYELMENAIQHNDSATPNVWISVNQETNGPVRLDIADDGPGIPEMEEDVLESGIETPLFHSLGLGLWLARIMVRESEGEVRIIENEPRGSIVRITLPSSESDQAENAGETAPAAPA